MKKCGFVMNDYYVYVYIDPRSFQEFYYGKGRGSRKNSHLTEDSDSAKSKQIKEIQAKGLDPIVRVIASNLSESDALLVEKTLLWKLGKQLTNVRSSGNDDAVNLTPPLEMTLEKSLEYIKEDEYVEITPENVRLRKKWLTENERKRNR